jgi:hypothetical protein
VSHHCSAAWKKFYENNSYLIWLPTNYKPQEVQQPNAALPNLLALLEPGEDAKNIRKWHEASRWLLGSLPRRRSTSTQPG